MKPSLIRWFFAFAYLFLTFFSQAQLSPLAPKPHWLSLNSYQESITRNQFETLIKSYYSSDGAFLRYCRFKEEKSVTIYQDLNKIKPLWTLSFHQGNPLKSIKEKPSLKGLVIALDPGHLGGEWARLEERYFQLGNNPPVKEWDLNFLTCRLIENELKKAGAKVVWVKKNSLPITSLRPDDLSAEAFYSLVNEHLLSPKSYLANDPLIRKKIEARANLLFYRVAEIRARAEHVNQNLKPDLTLCIHYNAAEWGDPLNPILVKDNRLVLFTRGSYLADELRYEDQKFHLLRKLFEGSRETEHSIAIAIAKQYQRVWSWPPELYSNAVNTIRNPKNPYVFSRNLLANRLYHGPVVFCEGPYMNAKDTYPRLIAGDYEGTRFIRGKFYRSIFREYAENVVNGLKNVYLN